MPVDASYAAAWLVGLLGGVHCVGMCGGLVAALAYGLAPETRARPRRLLPFLLAYNLGRIASYAAAGALLGGAGYFTARLLFLHEAQRVLQGLAALFMGGLGVYLAGWWKGGLSRVERVGARLWAHVQPLGRRLLPVQRLRQALLLGALWGWLPCGLVYSVLVWAMAAGSARSGALLMLSFGLGTLPTLVTTGTVAARVASLAHLCWVRRVVGGVILILAGLMLVASLH
jgi:sulfite exporter TauE/SafE